MHPIIMAAACIGLAGCAAANYANVNYQGIPFRDVAMPESAYRVIEKRGQNRMFVMNPTPGSLFGTVDTSGSGQLYAAAADRYLALTGRPHCRAVRSDFILPAEFEIFFTCRAGRT
ncbi:hypothetical protein [Labrys wisconsinensis]|uniref:Lipoprotein n=1 Tax=Labrys wisconsinensis TaxID=425677 RepID=A0ABU0J221_9HYPH|nr:hypothetical protein [Labrys wisconsinensis]MDQ0467369.1 hypothetical protein [Labrys wisconsinensis]